MKKRWSRDRDTLLRGSPSSFKPRPNPCSSSALSVIVAEAEAAHLCANQVETTSCQRARFAEETLVRSTPIGLFPAHAPHRTLHRTHSTLGWPSFFGTAEICPALPAMPRGDGVDAANTDCRITSALDSAAGCVGTERERDH